MTAFGYARVSTAEQVDHGLGLEVQREALLEKGCVKVFEDEGQSGSNGLDSRVFLAAAIDALKAGDVLVVYRLDRFARDVVLQETLLAEIRAKGAELVSCDPGEDEMLRDDKDPGRVMIRQIMGAINQYERSVIKMRMRAGQVLKARKGLHAAGPVPYGWKVDDGARFVHDPETWPIVEEIRSRRERGMSMGDIAALLNVRGIGTKRGFKWQAGTVHRVLNQQPPGGAHASRTEE